MRALNPNSVATTIGSIYEFAALGDVDGARAVLTPELIEYVNVHAGGAGDIASACALAGLTDEALNFLDSAIELGWFSPEFWARHDRSFEYLHGDERAREKAAAFEE